MIYRSLLLSCFLLLFACGNDAADANDSAAEAPADPTAQGSAVEFKPETLTAPGDLAADEDSDATTMVGPIAEIRESYKRIRGLIAEGQVRTEQQEVTCTQEDGVASITKYFAGDELVMAELTTGIGHYFNTRYIYYEGSRPFFVYEEEGNWEFIRGADAANGFPPTKTDMQEHRYYLNEEGTVLRKLDRSYVLRNDDEGNTRSGGRPNLADNAALGRPYSGFDAALAIQSGDFDC